MFDFKKLSSVNGFDIKNLDNARQNNYAWSMQELEDYIYVGTSRNIMLSNFSSIPGINPVLNYEPNNLDMTAEIWRYKKDGSEGWQRVLKTNPEDGVTGFRFMIKYNSFGFKPALYAASYGKDIKIYKSTNGVNWFQLTSSNLKGTSSRAMTIHGGKLYLATVDDDLGTSSLVPYIYSSTDPELYGWTLETPDPAILPSEDLDKNIQGSVQFIISFNDQLYAATFGLDGISLWRTTDSEPKVNGWKLVLDKGGGDAANILPTSLGIYKNYLYIGAGVNPSSFESFANPKGADLFRIDTKDHWELVAGSTPMIPTNPATGIRGLPISRLGSGFNNKYNFYMWQIRMYKGMLLVGTYDLSSSVESSLEMFIKNRDLFANLPGYDYDEIDAIIASLKQQVAALKDNHSEMGFDLFRSFDGVRFTTFSSKGLGNPQNSGCRILFESSEDELYIGTANPFEGCEVWKSNVSFYSTWPWA